MRQNKKSKGLLLAIFICMALIFMLPAAGSAMTGTGTSSDPYMIYNAADLQSIQNNLSASYKLANDIDLSGVSFVSIAIFSGTLDGDGHTIKNLSINGGRYTGLFGYAGGTIKNMVVTVKKVTSNELYTGGLVGMAIDCQISNVHIRKVDSNSIVSASGWVGGLVGYSINSTITNCSANINISGSGSGGLVGYCESVSIDKSYATGNVTGTGGQIGGLVGGTYESSISNSYATGNVTGLAGVGGLLGYGDENEIITNCYSIGQVSGINSGARNLGGFSGGFYGYDTLANCYYDSSKISGGNSYATPMTPEASLHQVTYIGFDFNSIWKIDEGSKTPTLRDMPDPDATSLRSANADLKDLSVNQYLLSGEFSVTPVASDAKATIKVNGQPVSSGSASQRLTLSSGTNTVTIVVTAEDGVTTKTYTETFNVAVGTP